MNDMHLFAQYLSANGRAERTVAGYAEDLGLFARWFEQTNGEPLAAALLTATDVKEYREHLFAVEHAAASTINRRLAAIRAYGQWLMESGAVPTNPTTHVRGVKKQKLRPRWLDRADQARLQREIERTINAARTEAARRQAARDSAIVALLGNAGLRVSELCALKLCDLEMSERKGMLIVRRGKGDKEREIPLNAPVRRAVAAWLAVRPPEAVGLFSGKHSGQLQPRAVQRILAVFARRAGVQLTPHTLRHTLAKNLARAHVPAEEIAAILGHSNLNTTLIYTLPGEQDLRQAVEALE